jgi:hypothetical protein
VEETSDIAFDKFIKSKMESAPVAESNDTDWDGMSKKMKVTGTFPKKPKRLIYYTGILVLLLSVLLYFVFNEQESLPQDPFKLKKEELLIPSKKTEDFQRKEENERKSVRTDIRHHNEGEKNIFPVQAEEKKDLTPALVNPVSDLKIDTSTSHSHILKPVSEQKPDSVNIPKKKKVKYVIKRDTIFSYDTMKVIKKR